MLAESLESTTGYIKLGGHRGLIHRYALEKLTSEENRWTCAASCKTRLLESYRAPQSIDQRLELQEPWRLSCSAMTGPGRTEHH